MRVEMAKRKDYLRGIKSGEIDIQSFLFLYKAFKRTPFAVVKHEIDVFFVLKTRVHLYYERMPWKSY